MWLQRWRGPDDGRLRMLITGFGTFPGAPANPTSWLMAKLQDRLGSGNAGLCPTIETLAASYRSVTVRAGHLRAAFAPHIVLHFGLKIGAQGFEIESFARNHVDRARVDAAGGRPDDPRICRNAPRVLRTTAPVRTLVAALRQRGLPAGVSTDAGRYVCNALYFSALLARSGSEPPGWDLFVHVPPTETEARPLLAARGNTGRPAILPRQQLMQGALVLIETLARVFARHRVQMGWA